MVHLHILFWVILTSSTLAAELPSTFTKCDQKQHDFEQCLTKAVENAIRQMNRPFEEVGLSNLEPLEIPLMAVSAGPAVVETQQILKNVKVSGFNETACAKVKFNFDTKTLTLDCTVPRFRMEYDYELNGQISLKSVYGTGTGWTVFEDNHFDVIYKLGEFEKKGKKYYNIIEQQLHTQPKNIELNLNNLFDGDEEAGNQFKKILTDNILEVFADVKPGYDEAFGKIFATIFDRLLRNVPMQNIFGQK